MQKIRPPLRWPGEVPISQVMTCMKLKDTPKKTSPSKKICMNLGEQEMPLILKSSKSYFLLSIVSCIIFWHWYNLSKKERASKPVPFSFAKIPIKKIWVNSEDWMLPPQWKPSHRQQEDWFTYNEKHGTAADRSPPSGDTMFSGNGTSRGVLSLLWYQKDTTYAVHFADASKKDCFQTVLFLFFWVHQHDKNKCRNGHLSDLFWQHCYSSEWQWMGFLGGACSP